MRNMVDCPGCREKLSLETFKNKAKRQEQKSIRDHMVEEQLNRLSAQMNSQHALINGLMNRIDSVDKILTAPFPTAIRIKRKYTRKKKRLGRPRKTVE